MKKFLVLGLLGLLAFNACNDGISPTTEETNSAAGRFTYNPTVVLHTDSGGKFSANEEQFNHTGEWMNTKVHTSVKITMYKWDFLDGEKIIRGWEKGLIEAGVTDAKVRREKDTFFDDLWLTFTLKEVKRVEVLK